jgi:transposase
MEKLSEGPYTDARLFREIKEMGFDSGETIVKDFVRTVRLQQEMPAVLRYDREGQS